MLVYVIMAVLVYVFLFFSKKENKNWKKRLLIVIPFIIMFFVSALRVNVGTDYNSYKEWFINTNDPYFHYSNFAFNNLIFIIKLFTKDPQIFFAVSSLIIIGLVYASILNNQKEYDIATFLFIALGFYFSSFNGVRQWIAMSIFMYAYKYVINKNIIKYILLVLIASLFHITAILLIPFYFVFNFRIKDKYKIIIVLLFLLIFKLFSFDAIMGFLLKTFAISFYWRYIAAGVDLSQGVGSVFPILLSGGLLLYYIFFKKYFIKSMDEDKYERNKHLCFIITLFAIINTVNNLFSRFALYFIPLLVILIPDCYSFFSKKWVKIIKILIIIVGLSFMIINTTLKNSNNPLPYCNIWGTCIK